MKGQRMSMLISAAVYMGIGVILILFPTLIGSTLCYILAGAFMTMGLVYIIGYSILAKKARDEAKPYGLIKGAALVLLGIFVLAKSRLVISIIPFIIGAMIIIKGIVGIQRSINLKTLGIPNYRGSIIGSVIIIIFGAVMMANPFETAKVISVMLGIGLFASGAADFILELQVRHNIKKQQGGKE